MKQNLGCGNEEACSLDRTMGFSDMATAFVVHLGKQLSGVAYYVT
jgi:hypothetical protein